MCANTQSSILWEGEGGGWTPPPLDPPLLIWWQWIWNGCGFPNYIHKGLLYAKYTGRCLQWFLCYTCYVYWQASPVVPSLPLLNMNTNLL